MFSTNFENELIQHSAGTTYQASGQMRGDLKRIETVSVYNTYRISPGRSDRNRDNQEVEGERAISEEVFLLLRGEEDAGGQREGGLRVLDL